MPDCSTIRILKLWAVSIRHANDADVGARKVYFKNLRRTNQATHQDCRTFSNVMEVMCGLTILGVRLNQLNHIYSIWRFNSYIRVTYVSQGWLVIWDHRHAPPARHDFRNNGDHETICKLAADYLQILESECRDC
jgi:hypothetical protein